MRKSTVVLAATLLATGPSLAQQWINKTDDDPFGTDKTSVSLTASGGYGFGFRCSGKADISLVYLTPETIKDGSLLGLVTPVLKVKVDNLEVVELEAQADEADGKLRIATSDTKTIDVAKSIGAARQRIAVAVELLGKRYHVQTFGTSGSKDSIGRAFRACKLDGSPS